jgi:hypothetical protein
MTDNSILQTYNGIIRFYDGTIIAIEDQEYSVNGTTHWEKIFNPYQHIYTLDGVTVVEGHKYKRVKHSGDTNFQLPYRLVPKEPEFKLHEGLLQWKFIEDSTWITLLDTETLKGEKGDTGDKGIQGDGINIDAVGYLKLRPDCNSGLIGTSTCTSCNPGSNDTSIPYLFLSIGDGVLVLTSTLIAANTVSVGGVSYTHFSNDLINWTALSAGIVDFECRYLATNSTGAVYTDMRLEDYYSSRGKVYICADGRWTLFVNLNVPLYMVQESIGSPNIGYLDNFVLALQDSLTGTITISNGKLEIIDYSIDATAFKQDTFTDGLDYTESDTEVKVKVEDFAAYGLNTFTSTLDNEENIQVDLTNLVSDGILTTGIDRTGNVVTTLDGETPILIRVNVDDFISPTTGTDFTGLETSTDKGIIETDGFDNIYIKTGDCILVDVNGVNVLVDDKTISTSSGVELKVYETNGSDQGIMNKHLHPNCVDSKKGIKKGNLLSDPLEIMLEPTTLEFIDGEITVKENGIKNGHLADDTCNEDEGIEVINGQLTVKYDDITIDVNGSGELRLKTSFLETTLEGYAVTSLNVGDDVLFGSINIMASNVGPAFATLALDPTVVAGVNPDSLDFVLTTDLAVLQGIIDAYVNKSYIYGHTKDILQAGTGISLIQDDGNFTITLDVFDGAVPSPATIVNAINGSSVTGSSIDYAREDHRHSVDDGALTISKTLNLQSKLDDKVDENIAYGNIEIRRGVGLVITSVGGTLVKKLIMDDNGNLDVESLS